MKNKLLLLFIAMVGLFASRQSYAQCLQTAPYSENFDGANWTAGTGFSNTGDAIDPCWSRNVSTGYFWGVRSGATGSTTTGPDDDFTGGGNYVFTEGSNGTTGDVAEFTSPEVDLSPLTLPEMRFYYHMYGGDISTLNVEVSDDGGSTWTNVSSVVGQQQTSSADPWQEQIVNISSYAGQTVQFRFSAAKGGTYCDIAIDEMSVQEAPNCPQPSNLSVVSSTTTDIELTWTNGGTETMWNIEYGAPGYTQGTGTLVPVTSNPATVSGLNPSTTYDFYIQADCGGGDESTWFGPFSASTACGIVSAPYSENFDGANFDPGSGALDQCWSSYTSSGAGNEYQFISNTGGTGSTGTGPSDDVTGGGDYVYTEGSDGLSGDTAIIYTPEIDLSALTLPYLSFYYHMYGSEITDLNVDISTDGGTTWTNEVTISGQQQSANGDAWLQSGTVLDSYVGQTVQVRFWTVRGGGYQCDVSLDNVELSETPACPDPSALEAVTITDTEVTLSWTNGYQETNWNIEYGPAGFTLGTGTLVPVTNNPATISGLTPETGYTFYLQADCGGGDESNWIGPLNVTTQCAAFVAPFLESFDIGSLPNCWTNNSSNPSNNGLWEFTGGPGYGAANNGRPDGTFAWTDGSTPEVADITLTSPLIDLSPLTVPMLQFDWFSNNEDYPGDNVPLIVEVNDGNGWTSLNTYAGDSPDWQDEAVVLANYIGQTVQIRFITDQTVTNNSAFYNDILLDSVEVLEAPSCPNPYGLTATNITANSADLNWFAGYQETEWVVEYGPVGFTPGNGTEIVTNDTTESLTGLNSATEYDFYVTAVCGASDSSEVVGPHSFVTDCAIYQAPFYEPFDDGTIPVCWGESASGTFATDFWQFNGTPGYAAANNGRPDGTFAWSDGSGNESEGTIISPEIDITTITDPYLSFEWFSNNENTPGDNVPLYVEVYGGTVWTPLDTLQGDSTEWMYASYDLADYVDSTTIQVRFITDHTQTSGSAIYNDILLDDVRVWSCIRNAGADGEIDVCRLDDTLDLTTGITVDNYGGRWSFPYNETLVQNDSILQVTTIAAGTYEAYYLVQGACQADTAVATINIYPPSSAGSNGSLTVCLNEPINLFDGLTGNVDLGGTWYDPSNDPLPGSQPTAANIPGNYNYDYIASNGVCPADTALVEVVVDGNCDWLSLSEEAMSEISVYPNPATNVINVVNPTNMSALKVEIVDVNGRIVAADDKALENSTEGSIAIDHLETGIYTLRVYGEDGQKTFKIVKQ